jgi:hypothetical protein
MKKNLIQLIFISEILMQRKIKQRKNQRLMYKLAAKIKERQMGTTTVVMETTSKVKKLLTETNELT